MSQIKPHGERILVRVLRSEASTASGLVVSSGETESMKWGLVESGTADILKGSQALFSIFQAVEVDPADKDLVVVKVADVIATRID
jgi:co-chaperonin GroES (HSP10)